jgi:RimJ/RimL family protein N-acetyltransferase
MILESLDDMWPWFVFRAQPPTLEDRIELAARQRAEAEAGKVATYLVFAGDEPVGKAWFDVADKTAEMGWWLRSSATRHGYATEAVQALATLAFEFGVERLEAHTDPDNTPSRALAERAGFVLERIRPDAHDRPDGVRRPDCIYVLLSERNRRS